MFDFGLLKSYQSSLKVISVGNLSTGGTGKTPFTELLIEAFKDKYKIAVLSRGYGRQSKGLITVETDSPVKEVGDESLHIKQKFPEIVVMVCEDRVLGMKQLELEDIDLVILDDAFQHRYIRRDVNILLSDFNRPFYSDYVLPTGNLREWRIGKSRADVIVVSKGPENLNAELKSKVLSKIHAKKDQSCYFAYNAYGKIKALFDPSEKDFNKYDNVLVVSGIAHGKDFYKHVSTLLPSAFHLNFEDHVDYNKRKVLSIVSKFNDLNSEKSTVILTTMKDAVKLNNFSEELKNIPVFTLEYNFQIHDYNQCIETIESKILT